MPLLLEILLVHFCLALIVGGQSLFDMARRSHVSAPSNQQRSHVPADMMKRYVMLSTQNADKISPNYDTVRHINGKKIYSSHGSLKIFYDISGLFKNELIEKDELHIYLNSRAPDSALSRSIPLTFEVTDLFSHRIISRTRLTQVSASSPWLEVSLKGWTRRWTRSRTLNRGLKIVGRGRDGKIVCNKDRSLFREKQPGHFLPYLLLYCRTKSMVPSLYLILQHTSFSNGILGKRNSNSPRIMGEKIRNPRSIMRNASCRHITVTMNVHVKSFYGTLISSGNYTTKKCMGNCSQTLPRSINNSGNCNSKLQDCCVPSLTKQFYVMYKDNLNNFIIKVIPNAIVQKCSCISALLSNGKP